MLSTESGKARQAGMFTCPENGRAHIEASRNWKIEGPHFLVISYKENIYRRVR